MSKYRHSVLRHLTLVEVLFVLAVLGILTAITFPLLHRAREKSEEVACINNIRRLSMAVQLYYNDNSAYPLGDFEDQLLEYYSLEGQQGDVLKDAADDAFYCPDKDTHYPYSWFYIPRSGNNQRDRHGRENYFLGCPVHDVVTYAPGKGSTTPQIVDVTFDGDAYQNGELRGVGTFRFGDGSTAEVVKGEAGVVTSFRRGDGAIYNILRIYDGDSNTKVNVTVPPGKNTKFEVVTPAAIAGVAGTEFTVDVTYNASDEVSSELAVTSGKVEFYGPRVVNASDLTSADPARKTPPQSRVTCHQRADRPSGGSSDGASSPPWWWPPWLPWPPWPSP